MPEISRFYGIVLAMFWRDHLPPHFHAYYGGKEAEIGLDGVLIGRKPATPRPATGGRVADKARRRADRQLGACQPERTH